MRHDENVIACSLQIGDGISQQSGEDIASCKVAFMDKDHGRPFMVRWHRSWFKDTPF